jgi:hypothetical protein
MSSKEQNKDSFDKIFAIQNAFTKKYFESNNIDIDKLKDNEELLVKWNKEYVLSIVKETTDLLDKLDWKMISQCTEQRQVSDNILEECIDIFKYLLGLMILNGFTKDEVVQRFMDKSSVVEAKYEQELAIRQVLKDKTRKIAFIDIDGVLANWPKCFIDFVNEKYNRKYASVKEIDQKELIGFKLEYRTSGAKKTLELNEHAVELTKHLKEKGYFVILLTARPYKKIFRIYTDTLQWLKSNDIAFDGIIWNENKEDFILRYFSEHDFFVIDDDLDNASKLVKNGCKVFLKNNKDRYTEKYIRDFISLNALDSITRIDSLNEMCEKEFV